MSPGGCVSRGGQVVSRRVRTAFGGLLAGRCIRRPWNCLHSASVPSNTCLWDAVVSAYRPELIGRKSTFVRQGFVGRMAIHPAEMFLAGATGSA